MQKPVGKPISAIEIVVCGNQISIFFACGSQNAAKPIKFDDFRLIQNLHLRKPPLVCPRSKTRGGFLKCQLPPTGEIWLYLVQKPVGKCISAIEIVVCGHQMSIFFACGSQNASEPIKFDDFSLIQNWHLRKPPPCLSQIENKGGLS